MAQRSDIAKHQSLETDPVWQAAMRAPLDPTPDTEEERAAIAEAKASGEWIDGDCITSEIESRKNAEG